MDYATGFNCQCEKKSGDVVLLNQGKHSECGGYVLGYEGSTGTVIYDAWRNDRPMQGVPTPPYETKDSGKRMEFPTGMKRDTNEGKARYDLVFKPTLRRWAELMARGAVKYGANNWKKAATQEELDRFLESANRHFEQWMAGDTDEDHAAAVFFNISGAEYVKQRMEDNRWLSDQAYKIDMAKLGEIPMMIKPGPIVPLEDIPLQAIHDRKKCAICRGADLLDNGGC